MQRISSVLTPTSGEFRPTDSGWVAYHDVSDVLRTPGIAMSWRDGAGALRWAAVIDRAVNRTVTWTGDLQEDGDVARALMDALAKPKNRGNEGERAILRLMFPQPSVPDPSAKPGLPPVVPHADMAARALGEAKLPPAMREALLACVRHGVPKNVSVLFEPRAPELPGRRRLEQIAKRPSQVIGWERFEFAAKSPPMVKGILQADPALLDQMRPFDALRERWPGITEAHLRRIPEPDPEFPETDMFATNREEARNRLALLSAIPVDWMPVTRDVYAFGECASAIGRIAVSGRVDAADLVASAKGDWNAFAVRMYHAAGIDPDRADGMSLHMLALKCDDCKDPVRSLADGLLMPLLLTNDDDWAESVKRQLTWSSSFFDPFPEAKMKIAYGAASELLYGTKSAPSVLETSAEWHARQGLIESGIRRDKGSAGWPALFAGDFRHGGMSVRALASYDELNEEGGKGLDRDGKAGLSHCVVSYMPEAMEGKCHILSVRKLDSDGSWSRISTCQVSVSDVHGGRPIVSVVQHRGRSNVPPSQDAKLAVDSLITQIRAGGFPVNAEALSPRPRPRDPVASSCGYDYRNPDELANALAVWEPMLPRWARGMGPSEFLEALVERGLVPESETRISPAPSM